MAFLLNAVNSAISAAMNMVIPPPPTQPIEEGFCEVDHDLKVTDLDDNENVLALSQFQYSPDMRYTVAAS